MRWNRPCSGRSPRASRRITVSSPCTPESAFSAWSTSSEQLRATTLNLFERAARDAGLSPSDIRGLFFIDTEDDAADAREY